MRKAVTLPHKSEHIRTSAGHVGSAYLGVENLHGSVHCFGTIICQEHGGILMVLALDFWEDLGKTQRAYELAKHIYPCKFSKGHGFTPGENVRLCHAPTTPAVLTRQDPATAKVSGVDTQTPRQTPR